jgi:hypothetical protein
MSSNDTTMTTDLFWCQQMLLSDQSCKSPSWIQDAVCVIGSTHLVCSLVATSLLQGIFSLINACCKKRNDDLEFKLEPLHVGRETLLSYITQGA